MSPTCWDDISDMSATDKNVCRLRGVADRHICRHCQPSPSSGDARGIVPAHRDGHRYVQQSGYILHLCFVCCRPSGCRGDTERVFAQWRHLVAFMKALVMLHRGMPHVPHQHLHMAIEIACDGGAFVCCRRLFCFA